MDCSSGLSSAMVTYKAIKQINGAQGAPYTAVMQGAGEDDRRPPESTDACGAWSWSSGPGP